MNFSIIREHRDFFRKHHWIECEGVLTADEQARLSDGIKGVLAARLKAPAAVLSLPTSGQLFAAGRDVWRGEAALKKILLSRNLAEIAGELLELKPMRFGYDMLLPAPKSAVDAGASYAGLLEKTPTIVDISGIQGVLCGAVICVAAPSPAAPASSESESESVRGNLFSAKPGNVVFFSADWPLPLQDIYMRPGYQYLLVVYSQAKSVYFRQEQDPHLHDFKQLGYQFGDRLTDLLNPIVYP